jgi:hypothetical protein
VAYPEIPGEIPAAEVARRAGHGVAVLLKIYAYCIDGQADAASPSDSAPPSPSPALAMKATPTASRQPEVADQQPGADAERSLYRSCGRSAHRSCPRRPCPSVDSAPSEPGAHGRIADDGGPQSSLEAHMCWSAGGDSGGASGL